jgi:hypothetical protein
MMEKSFITLTPGPADGPIGQLRLDGDDRQLVLVHGPDSLEPIL